MDRIHSSASNPNLITHYANLDHTQSSAKPIIPVLPLHEVRIQEIRVRENFLSTAENGKFFLHLK